MANKIETLAYKIGDEIAKEYNFTLLHASYKKEGNDYYLRLAIDKEGGIGIDDCETFSRAFSDRIDSEDPIEKAYILEVTSPGVERKLTTQREFSYYKGRLVEVKLFTPNELGKVFKGELLGYEDSKVIVSIDGKTYDISLKDAVYIKLYFEF